MARGGDWQLSDQSTGVWRVAFFDFATAAELACFHNFRSHLLTNPVRYIKGLMSSLLGICDPRVFHLLPSRGDERL